MGIQDDISLRRRRTPPPSFPIVTTVLIGMSYLVFVYQLSLSSPGLIVGGASADAIAFFSKWGFTPQLLSISTFFRYRTIFTWMFVHGGLTHLIGNMVVLWVFGDNVEAKLGHSKYLVFYMVTGVASALSHWMVDPSSELPLVGASGAIAGVMGAYLVAFPRNHVKLLVLPLPKVFEIPSFIVLGLWFILQLIQSFVSLGTADEVNVAFMSHIGGFITGAVIMVGFDRLTERGRGISAGVISMPTGEPRSIEYWSCFQCRHRWIKDDKTPERCPECARTNWHI